jgi:uncharacterized protein YcbX
MVRIQLHPIKGMDAVCAAEARVLPSGALEFDRRWALLDGRGRFVSGKNLRAIHSIRARFDLKALTVALDGHVFSLQDGDAIARWCSQRFGQPVTWREDAAVGFPDDLDSPGPTLISTASLEEAAKWFGISLNQVRARFRTNLEIPDVPAFWEDRLYGSNVRIGEVKLTAVNPCQRCVVPSRDPGTGVELAGFQKRFAELRKLHLPDWAKTEQFNHYYRFAVNTRVVQSGVIRLDDSIETD